MKRPVDSSREEQERIIFVLIERVAALSAGILHAASGNVKSSARSSLLGAIFSLFFLPSPC